MSSKYLPASRPQALASAGGEYLEFFLKFRILEVLACQPPSGPCFGRRGILRV